MKNLYRLIGLPLFCALILQGCTAVGHYEEPDISDVSSATRIVSADFDTAWGMLIEYAAETFFHIENFEKDSGLIALSFGSDDPSRFIDCGYMEASATDQNLRRHEFSGSYVDFLNTYHEGRFSGRVNIIVRDIDSEFSRVTVNVQYTLDSKHNSWVFETGSYAEVTIKNALPGTPPTRLCAPTYEIENIILNSLDERLI